MQRYLLSIWMVTLFLTASYAQRFDVTDMYSGLDKVRVLSDTKNYDEINGNPYLSTEYRQCVVYAKDKNIYKANLRYDIYADEMEFVKENIKYWIAKEIVDSVVFEDSKFIFTRYYNLSKFPQGYFQLIQDGQYRLLTKRTIKFNIKEPAKPIVESKPDRFTVEADQYFIQKDSGPAVRITSLKTLNEAFPLISGKANAFIKANKTAFNNQEKMKELTIFINSLQ